MTEFQVPCGSLWDTVWGESQADALQILKPGSHLLHLVVKLSPESNVVRSEATGLSCSNKNRQFTVISLWFNNAFKRGSKWLIKSGDLVTPACFISTPSELVPFASPRLPRDRLEWRARRPIPQSQAPASSHLSPSFSIPLWLFPSLLPSPSLFSFFFFFWTMEVEWQCKSQSLLKKTGQGGRCHPYLWALNGFYQSEVALNHGRAVINTTDST